MADEDSELVLRCQRGDQTAFQALVERHKRRAYWIAYEMVSDAESARDISQEAFIRVFRGIGSFNPKNSFAAWLYRIVTNLAVDELRTRMRDKSVQFHEGLEDAAGGAGPTTGDASAAVEAEETRRQVREVLSLLPLRYRMVLAMRDLEGMSFKDIARMLSCPQATVRWRLHKARRLFKDAWIRHVERSAPEIGGAGGEVS